MFKKTLSLDSQLTEKLQLSESKSFYRQAVVFFAHSGDSWFWLAGLFLIWLFSAGKRHQLAAVFAAAIIIQAVIVILIKFAIRRRRPEGTWGEVYRKTDPHSFPSGHAVRAVMLAFMAWGLNLYPLNWILAFWAPIVSYARIALGLHYIIDVVAGWVLGIMLAFAMLNFYPILMQLFPWVF